ncbi:hypothetical protein BD779DRAFT_1559250 [Infundibulicybe gibba]|nr:hypothetical protein BD779DRAFT_1559250 [Infundibulicybe gibba]
MGHGGPWMSFVWSENIPWHHNGARQGKRILGTQKMMRVTKISLELHKNTPGQHQ